MSISVTLADSPLGRFGGMIVGCDAPARGGENKREERKKNKHTQSHGPAARVTTLTDPALQTEGLLSLAALCALVHLDRSLLSSPPAAPPPPPYRLRIRCRLIAGSLPE